MTIGRYPNWTMAAARTEARRLKRLIDIGGDPLADIKANKHAARGGLIAGVFATRTEAVRALPVIAEVTDEVFGFTKRRAR